MKTIFKTLLITLFATLISINGFANTGTDEVRELTIKGTDNLKFSETLIEASPGETIRLTFEVVSNMPKTAMGHNIAIVDKDADVQNFVMQSMSAEDNEYIAPALEDQVVAFTKMIGGGETSVIEFTVPDEPGDYVYVCTFPGHYFAGMKGILRVK
ncbi:plastocyanin/azurin family copper-binding protein [Rhodohalobacter sp. 8-1]|uniref:plastocyanin/azurin family copper-binding protein n=1 Tax=Rhodohalobacter sp. 8-1 TaxID=3131972 RepID=UPI0030EEAE7D